MKEISKPLVERIRESAGACNVKLLTALAVDYFLTNVQEKDLIEIVKERREEAKIKNIVKTLSVEQVHSLKKELNQMEKKK